MLEEILAYNKKFVEDKGYEAYITNKYPDKKIAILSCMDTRLTALLPAALGIKNGDVKMIKNAGGVISHPFGSVRNFPHKPCESNRNNNHSIQCPWK